MKFLRALILGLAVASLLSAVETRAPNILSIAVDDLSDTLSAYGPATTPHSPS